MLRTSHHIDYLFFFFSGKTIKAELSTIRLLTAEHMEQCRRPTKKRLCSTHNFYYGQMLRDENERGSLAFEQLSSLLPLCFPSLGHGNWILQRNTWHSAFLSLVTHGFLAHGDLERFPCCSAAVLSISVFLLALLLGSDQDGPGRQLDFERKDARDLEA